MTPVDTTNDLTTTWRWMDSPFGRVLLVADGAGLREIRFARGEREPRPETGWQPDGGRLKEVVEQLEAYFAGRLREFTLALAPRGTPFRQDVWEAVRSVPYGETTTYGAIAAAIGRPSAVRAVGAANGANPLPVVIPCHRVIGSGGKLTGYGGGLDMKAELLAHERGTRRLL